MALREGNSPGWQPLGKANPAAAQRQGMEIHSNKVAKCSHVVHGDEICASCMKWLRKHS